MAWVVSGYLLDRLATTDRLHVDSGLELGTVFAALAYLREPHLGAITHLRGSRRALSIKTRPRHPTCVEILNCFAKSLLLLE